MKPSEKIFNQFPELKEFFWCRRSIQDLRKIHGKDTPSPGLPQISSIVSVIDRQEHQLYARDKELSELFLKYKPTGFIVLAYKKCTNYMLIGIDDGNDEYWLCNFYIHPENLIIIPHFSHTNKTPKKINLQGFKGIKRPK